MSDHQEFHIEITQGGISLLEHLYENTSFTKRQLKSFLQKGAVWVTSNNVTKRVRRAKRTLPANATLHLYVNHKVLEHEIPAPLLIEDSGEYSIWYKPAGVLCQGSKWGDHCTINRWIEANDFKKRRAYIVHRLDKFTRGLIVIVHNREMAKKFTRQFEQRKIEKKYQTLVHGIFPEQTITMDKPIDGRDAVSIISRQGIDQENKRTLLEIEIKTGRKHQVRRHTSQLGYPVIGDRLYGESFMNNGRKKNGDMPLQLVAYSLAFSCPITDEWKQFQLPKSYLPNLGAS